MPFIRQTRDKRGFEHTYVMHNGRPGSGPPRPRVLYVFRSPGNLKVGRRALDSEVREALEHTHPDLTFDWNSLTREAVVSRAEPPQPRPQRPAKTRPQPPPPQPSAPEVPLEDHTLLGRVLGPAVAARLRGRFSEISQRIVRRARTPEEREALLERARPLNPDAWADEAAVRTAASNAEAELDRLAADLPSRRRGRRGGRHRLDRVPGPGEPMAEVVEDSGPDSSGIMAGSDETHEESNDTGLDRSPDAPDAGRGTGISPADPEATGIPEHD